MGGGECLRESAVPCSFDGVSGALSIIDGILILLT